LLSRYGALLEILLTLRFGLVALTKASGSMRIALVVAEKTEKIPLDDSTEIDE
jgi:hypothetical protein